MTKKARRRSYERKIDQPIAITPIEMGRWQSAFEHFNAALFDGALPQRSLLHVSTQSQFGRVLFAGSLFEPRRRVWEARDRAQS